MRETKDKKLRLVALILALAMVLTTALPANIVAQAAGSEAETADVSAVATPGDAPVLFKASDGYYYYYVKGEKVLKTGWMTVAGKNEIEIKLDNKSRVQYKVTIKDSAKYVSRYDTAKKDFVKYTKNVIVLSDKKLYYTDANGKIVTKAGNVYDGKGTTYVLGNKGVVTAKFVKSGEARRFYRYSAGKWNVLKGKYMTFAGKLYYFSAKSGIATMMYDNSTQKLYKYKSSKMTLVKSDISTINSKVIYLFGSNGQRVKKSGWYKLASGTKVYVGAKGYVTAKITASGKSQKYYTYDYSALKWAGKKNAWIKISGTDYYFTGNGVAVYAYNTGTGRFTVYKGGKWNLAKNSMYKLRNGKIYLTNAKSVVVKKSGWYKVSSTDRVYVGAKGYVTMKFSDKTGKLAKYNYTKKAWELVKTSTYKIDTKTYYFGTNGAAVYAVDTKTNKVTMRKSGKWTVVKKAVCNMGGKLYLAGHNSVIVKKAGWYSISKDETVCVGAKGYVTMKFSDKTGKLTKYNYGTKKWELVKATSYKVGSTTYYFNSNGVRVKNGIVGNNSTGYFYVDETGCKVTSQEIQMAVDFVRQHTNDSMTNEEKLYASFIYLSRNYPYLRDYVVPTDASRFTYYCIDMLTNNHGNCYRCAATFATVATVLGYKARVTCGKVTNLQGDGFTIHGWTELWRPEDNEWVVYDVSMQRNWPARDYYHVLMKDYYPTHRVIGPRARLTVKNGKVNWRWLADSELGDH